MPHAAETRVLDPAFDPSRRNITHFTPEDAAREIGLQPDTAAAAAVMAGFRRDSDVFRVSHRQQPAPTAAPANRRQAELSRLPLISLDALKHQPNQDIYTPVARHL